MRIVLFSPVFLRPTETFIYDAATELVASGAQLMAVAANRDSEAQFPFDDVEIIPRVGKNIAYRAALKPIRLISHNLADCMIETNQQKRFHQVIRFCPERPFL